MNLSFVRSLGPLHASASRFSFVGDFFSSPSSPFSASLWMPSFSASSSAVAFHCGHHFAGAISGTRWNFCRRCFRRSRSASAAYFAAAAAVRFPPGSVSVDDSCSFHSIFSGGSTAKPYVLGGSSLRRRFSPVAVVFSKHRGSLLFCQCVGSSTDAFIDVW